MSIERELEKELRSLRNVFWKMFMKSREFRSFKKKLKKLNLDADVFLAMFIFGEKRASIATSRDMGVKKPLRKSPPKLTTEDRRFLRSHGLKWE